MVSRTFCVLERGDASETTSEFIASMLHRGGVVGKTVEHAAHLPANGCNCASVPRASHW
jgi:hypothetical protein